MQRSIAYSLLLAIIMAGACTVGTAPACDSLGIRALGGTMVFVGDSLQLQAVRQTLDLGSEGPGGCVAVTSGQFDWNSTNNQALTVTAEGLVRARSAGVATISATGYGHQASILLEAVTR